MTENFPHYPPGHQAGPRLEVVGQGDLLSIDTIRALFTYGICAVVVVGGGWLLFVTRQEVLSTDLRIMIAGFIGSALTFAFGQEVQTRTARQAASSTAASTAATTATIAAANSGVGVASNGTPKETPGP